MKALPGPPGSAPGEEASAPPALEPAEALGKRRIVAQCSHAVR